MICRECGSEDNLMIDLDENLKPYYICKTCYIKDHKSCENCDNFNEINERCDFWHEQIDDPENDICDEYVGLEELV